MLYEYTATTVEGREHSGSIEVASMEIAINSLQNRNLIITSIKPIKTGKSLLNESLSAFFNYVSRRDIVILSRQLATLFEAKISVIEAMNLLSAQTKSLKLREVLGEIIKDVKGGSSISQAMTKHPFVFSSFYVNMVKSGEESGKLEEVFSSLANHLERSYEITSKAKNALVYPSFVMASFLGVVVLMLVYIIPRLTAILTETGQAIPIYTRILIGISNLFRDFGLFMLLGAVIGGVFLWRYSRTEKGRMAVSSFQLSIPIIGGLYTKLYLARITDNMGTLLSSGVLAVRTLEITADVVGNGVYRAILLDAVNEVNNGKSISYAFSKYEEIPQIVTQMIKTGEESGRLNFMLETLGRFYKREIDITVDTIVSLIEPTMIILLGGSVGILLVSILGPIYNITSGI